MDYKKAYHRNVKNTSKTIHTLGNKLYIRFVHVVELCASNNLVGQAWYIKGLKQEKEEN